MLSIGPSSSSSAFTEQVSSSSKSRKHNASSSKYMMKQCCCSSGSSTTSSSSSSSSFSSSSRRSALILLTVFLCLATYLWFSLSGQHFDDFEDYSDLNERNKRIYFPHRFPALVDKIMEPDLLNADVSFKLDYSIIHEHQRDKMLLYLTALHRGVSILELPFTASLRKALKDCEDDHKSTVYDSQYALELKYPELLRFLNKASDYLEHSEAYRHTAHLLQLLHHTRTVGGGASPIKQGRLRISSNDGDKDLPLRERHYQDKPSGIFDDYQHIFEEPLIYYVNSYLYSVVHCSHHPQVTEDWKSGFRYLQEISPMIIASKEWKENEGLDFLSPASHPKSGLTSLDSASINSYSRQAFMRVDFDISGYSPKDLVVPYYVDTTNNEKLLNIVEKKRIMQREMLLVFIGHDHPLGGLRSQLQKELKKLDDVRDVSFVTDIRLPEQDYRETLANSKFCLSMRGDTSSAARLFMIIDIGCIPVIISDWQPLPFETIIDYSKFSLKFSERVIHDLPAMLTHLRTINSDTINNLKKGVQEAKKLLLFENSEHELPILNPISLSLIELFQKREHYCSSLNDVNLPPICMKILNRLHAAEHLLKNKVGPSIPKQTISLKSISRPESTE